MAAAVVLFVFPWVLDYVMLRANKQREAKMAELPADHVFPEGPIGHMDGKEKDKWLGHTSDNSMLTSFFYTTVRFRYVL